VKVTELQAEKYREGLDEECDRFCAAVFCMYYTFVEHVDKWTKCTKDFSCFMWRTLDEPEPLDDIKCFDHIGCVKKFTESQLNDDEFAIVLAHQKYSE
jgi:hypothetical protein